MKAIYFIGGFIYNLSSLLFEAIPMSIAAGMVCVQKGLPIWEIDEIEFLEALQNYSSEE